MGAVGASEHENALYNVKCNFFVFKLCLLRISFWATYSLQVHVRIEVLSSLWYIEVEQQGRIVQVISCERLVLS